MQTITEHPRVLIIPVNDAEAVGSHGVGTFYSHDFFPTINEVVGYTISPLSRAVGADRIVDELILTFTHSQETPWMLPGVPPTGRQVEIPIVVIVALNDGKIESEHLYWDQACVLKQIGLLQDDQLPVVGAEVVRTLQRLRAPA